MSRRKRILADLDAQIRDHIEREAEDNIARGMSPEEARNAALRKFGNVTRVKEDAREIWTVLWLERLMQDVRFALRMLRKNPGFATVAILTLALGIGLNATMFTVADAMIFRAPAWIAAPQDLVQIRPVTRDNPDASVQNISVDHYKLFSQSTHVIDVVAEAPTTTAHLDDEPGERPIRIACVSHNYFQLLGAPLLMGRSFTSDEEVAPRSSVVILGYGLWRRNFSGSSAVLNRFVSIGGKQYQVVGITPRDFNGTDMRSVDVYLLINEAQSPMPSGYPQVSVLGRPHPGFTIPQIQADLDVAFHQSGGGSQSVILVKPLFEGLSGRLSNGQHLSLWLAAISLLVLLIACLNVANVSLARMAQRSHEFAVRLQLGANWQRLMRQVFVESALLCALGLPFAFLLDFFAQPLVRAYLLPPGFYAGGFFNWRLFATMAAVAVVACLVTGLVPAWSVSRSQLMQTLKSHGPGYTLSRSRLRGVLLAGQMALTLFLCVGAGLLLRSLGKVLAIDIGYDPRHTLVVTIDPDMNGYKPADTNAAYDILLQRAQALPGIEHAALWSNGWERESFSIIRTSPHRAVSAGINWVTPEYFPAMGMRLLRGRLFTDQDVAQSQPVAVVTDEFLQDAAAAGISPDECLPIYGTDSCYQIVGVVKATRIDMLIPLVPQPGAKFKYSTLASSVYIPLSDAARHADARLVNCLVIRPRNDPTKAISAVFSALSAAAPKRGSITVKYVSSYFDRQTLQYRSQAALVALFAAIALTLAAVGIYGVVAFLVKQRTPEIGVRMVVGAQRSDVLRLVLWQGMKIVAIGLLIGAAASWGATRLMTKLLYGITPTDPLAFLAATSFFLGVALLACYIPARRATRVDPVTALRSE